MTTTDIAQTQILIQSREKEITYFKTLEAEVPNEEKKQISLLIKFKEEDISSLEAQIKSLEGIDTTEETQKVANKAKLAEENEAHETKRKTTDKEQIKKVDEEEVEREENEKETWGGGTGAAQAEEEIKIINEEFAEGKLKVKDPIQPSPEPKTKSKAPKKTKAKKAKK